MVWREKREPLRHCWHKVEDNRSEKVDLVCCHCDRHHTRLLESFSTDHGQYAPKKDKTERRWENGIGSANKDSVCSGYKRYPEF